MKKVILVLLVVLAFYGLGRLNKFCSDKVYDSCMESGYNSEETCYAAAYNN